MSLPHDIRQAVRLIHKAPDAGYRADNVVAMNIRLPFRRLITATPGEIEAYWRSIEREVAAVPQLRVASLDLHLPLSGLGMRQTFEIVGSRALDPANRPLAQYHIIGAGYFDALGVPLVRGRAFTDRDSETAPEVCIVNDAFVRRFLAGRDPIGARISIGVPGISARIANREIVGVVRQVKVQPDEARDSVYQIYVPTAQ
ncbi:MAG TPA: ABC transporter permease, partial [Vicinamibacterales bacterium]|nr:ABC transporter permease [Vicinamibacterales bacterium]